LRLPQPGGWCLARLRGGGSSGEWIVESGEWKEAAEAEGRRIMVGKADLIECGKGADVQVEISLPRSWTLYSKVYRSEEQAKKAADYMSQRLGFVLEWSNAEAEGRESA